MRLPSMGSTTTTVRQVLRSSCFGLTSRRSRQQIPPPKAHGASQRLFRHDVPRALGFTDIDQMSFQSSRVHRAKLYLFRKVGCDLCPGRAES